VVEPAPEDWNAVWRIEVDALIRRYDYLLEKYERDERYAVASGSDLWQDRCRLPDLWVDSVVSREMAHSIDCLHGIRDLAAYGTHFYAHFVLMRAVLESSATVVWLLQPDDQNLRLRRLLAQHNDNWRERKNVYGLTDMPSEVACAEGQAGLKRMVDHVGLSAADCRWPGYTAIIKETDDLAGTPSSVELVWRICSGVAHAKTWAITDVTHEVAEGPKIESGRYSARVPSYEMVRLLLDNTFRTAGHADALFDVRRTARPHSMTVELKEGLPTDRRVGAKRHRLQRMVASERVLRVCLRNSANP
jgi:hypothetical protein